MILKSIKRYWQIRTGRLETPVDGAGPFWIVSAAFHVLLIALLARFIMDANEDKAVVLEAQAPVEEIIEEQDVSLELDFDELEMAEIGADGGQGELISEVAAPTVDVMTEDTLNLDENVSEHGELFSPENFMDTSATAFAPVHTKGSVGAGTSSTAGAVDRLTQEILFSLEERATTVVWVFDQSVSLLHQRGEIVQRFDRIYRELGMIDEQGHSAFKDKGDSPLLTQVVAFGADYSVLGKPTADVDAVKASIEGIETLDTWLEERETRWLEDGDAALDYITGSVDRHCVHREAYQQRSQDAQKDHWDRIVHGVDGHDVSIPEYMRLPPNLSSFWAPVNRVVTTDWAALHSDAESRIAEARVSVPKAQADLRSVFRAMAEILQSAEDSIRSKLRDRLVRGDRDQVLESNKTSNEKE